jgi:hypothetical protein
MLTLATVLVATGAFAATGAVAAASPTSKVVVPVPSAQLPENGLHLTSAQVAQLNQSAGFLSQKGLWAEFSGTDGALTLNDPLSTLQTKYSLSSAQVQTIQSILSYDKQRVATASTRKTGVVSPDISVNGLVIYFTFSDVGGLLITAASAGPWAMLAALDLVASMFGGPIGTVIGGILGLIGISTIGQIAYRTVQGYSMHEGVYFGFTFNWFWPNWVLDNWCGCN